MSVLISLVIWIVIIGLLVWAEGILPIDPTVVRIIQAATAIVGVLLIAQRFLLA
jgi:hypothetical protein